MEGYAELNRGYSLMMMGKKKEASLAIDAADAIAKEAQNSRLAIAAAAYRARSELGEKDSESVAATALAAAEAAKRVGLPGLRIYALVIAARAKLSSGATDAARAYAKEALDLRDELGSVEEDEAEIFLVLAQALIALSRQDEARQILARGKKVLEAVALGIGDAEWRRRFLEDVVAHKALIAMASTAGPAA